MDPTRGELLYEGKSKQVYATSDPELVVLKFKDDATAFNGVKKASIADKGRVNCAITVHLLGEVEKHGVRSHLIKPLSPTELLCKRVEIVPVEMVVRNAIAGSLAKRYGQEEGKPLPWPLVELFHKSDALGDPLMTEDHAVLFNWAKRWEIAAMRESSLAVNDVLLRFFGTMGVDLVDFKLEFGRTPGGNLVLADEIAPDGMRLWDKKTKQKLDKDVFRRDLGDLGDTYRQLYQRIFGRPLGESGAP